MYYNLDKTISGCSPEPGLMVKLQKSHELSSNGISEFAFAKPHPTDAPRPRLDS